MNLKKYLLTPLLTTPLLLSAGTVVELDTVFSFANKSPDRALDVDTATEKAYNWDDLVQLFENEPSKPRAGFYAGVSATQGEIGDSQVEYNDRANGTGQLSFGFNHGPANGTGGPSRIATMALWDSNDFLTGDNTWDASAGSAFNFDIALNAQGAMNFVIRNGADYYVSNISFFDTVDPEPSPFGLLSDVGSFDGTTAGLQWGTFGPANFADYDGGAADLGLGVTFAEETFDKVTGAGFIGDAEKSNPNTFTAVGINAFEVSLVPEPSAYALLSGLVVMGLAAVRRRV